MNRKVKQKLRNIISIYLFFILLGIFILYAYKLKLHIEELKHAREMEVSKFRQEGFIKYNLSAFVDAKLEFTNHKGENYLIEDENDMKKIDTEKEVYITEKTENFGSYRFIEGEYTQERINNFNDNMKHIRLWDYDEKKYVTITENEKMEEFIEVKNIDELYEYMITEVPEGRTNMSKLDIIGYDGTSQPTKIIYDYGNGEIHIITESGTLSLGILFENYLKDI